MRKIQIHLGERSYPVVIGKGLLRSLGRLVKPLGLGRKIFMVTNRKVARFFLGTLRRSLIQAGFQVHVHLLRYGNERDKSEKSLFGIWRAMAEAGLERTSTVLALGGGVVGDVAGFAASTYMRGIPLVQVPTTLLAQVDAAIGGKTAIDLPSAKNMVGTFYQPRLVLVDVETLRALAKFGFREIQNAFSEVIKYGVIRDRSLFKLLEDKLGWFFSSIRRKYLGHRELAFLEQVIAHAVRVKARVVEADERETRGKRMLLNYGHTFAHAFEAASHYRLPHGKAVALGMVSAGRLARERGMFRKEDENRQRRLIASAGLPTRLQGAWFQPERVIRHMRLDKKKKNGRLRFVLPEAIGKVKVIDHVSFTEVRKVLKRS